MWQLGILKCGRWAVSPREMRRIGLGYSWLQREGMGLKDNNDNNNIGHCTHTAESTDVKVQ